MTKSKCLQVFRSGIRGRKANSEGFVLPQEVLHVQQLQAPARRQQLRQRPRRGGLLLVLLQGMSVRVHTSKAEYPVT